MGIEFEFFRVLPVLLFFIAASYAFTERSKAWWLMVWGLILNGLLWLIITLFMTRNYPALSKRPSRTQCYFWHQKDTGIDNGMPSGHCQSVAFFGTWLVLIALYYKVHPGILLLAVVISLFMIVGMIHSRVTHYKCHTRLQALVGTGLGSITALMFYAIL